jgi:uncharacterized protein
LSRLLFHVVSGPESPSRAALALLVAKTAAAAGHEVDVFFAGDGVNYLRDETMDSSHGVGLGSVREHFTGLVEAGGRIHASGMSAKARGIDAAVAGEGVTLSPPDRLVELITEADKVITY